MNILAIRGGGCRGVIVTKFLIEIERLTGKRIYELFDYIGGSSVGCLIATGILMSNDDGTIKYTAKDLHNILIDNMNETFSWTYSSWIRSGFGLIGSSYTNIGLLNNIDKLCGNDKLGKLLRPVIFPAYDRISHRAYYFERDKDSDLLLKDVIMSCTAAPTYFPSHKMTINDKIYDMVDGGIVINNTVELAFLSATKNMTCIDKSKILEVNLGTGIFENNIADSHGLLTWMPVIVNTLMHACNENELYELSLSLSKDNYYIMDVPLDVKYYSVDDTKSIDYYINETEKWITNNNDAIKDFCAKLMINKGFDSFCIYEDKMEKVNIENKSVNEIKPIIQDNNKNTNETEIIIQDDICENIENKTVNLIINEIDNKFESEIDIMNEIINANENANKSMTTIYNNNDDYNCNLMDDISNGILNGVIIQC